MHSSLASVGLGLHYACACATVVVASLASLGAISSKKAPDRGFGYRKKCSRWWQVLIIATYVVETIVVVLAGDDVLATDQAPLVHLLVAALTWTTLLVQKKCTAFTVFATAVTGLALEIPLCVLSNLQLDGHTLNVAALVLQAIRVIAFAGLMVLTCPRRYQDTPDQDDDQPLFRDQENGYGAIPESAATKGDAAPGSSDDSDDDSEQCGEDVALIKERRAEMLKQRGGWLGYLREFKVFAPHIIPRHDGWVQFCYLICLLCMIAARALNVILPVQLGKVADNLTSGKPPYRDLGIWLLLSFARYDPGLDTVQALAKIPIENFSYASLTNAAFNHVMSLSMDFHSERDSAEVIRAIEQGNAITNLLSTFVLSIIPTILDLVIALVYLSQKFNQIVAVALLACAIAFIGSEIMATSWNLGNRRAMAKASRQEAKVILQAVQGWQTVSFFNRFGYERQRFGQAVQTQLIAKQRWGVADAMVQAVVEGLFPTTFFVLACLVMREISVGNATPGDFVFLMEYWDRLTWPISMLSHNCRFLMSDLVDAERLLHLFQTQPTITSRPDALSIPIKGEILFSNVDFAYDAKQPILHDISLAAHVGKTIAFVGETGAGKSSVTKLLLRLYDVSAGRITLDGHDVRHLSLDSLRTAIGVVPQAPLLFNGSILENLRYARLDASDAEIESACRAAAIHDKILTFADGYATRVGEQGVKLSGGEIQRLAIARVFLKDPPVLILDEATSAVDSLTEAAVQGALEGLRKGRTTMVIAHRLSTVVKADCIFVMHEGRVVERGSHEELLGIEGRYWRMWTSQTMAGCGA